MPLNDVAFQALFAGSPKPYAQYEQVFGGKAALYNLYQSLGQPRFQRLVQCMYPDLVKSMSTGLTALELQTVTGMTAATLTSLREVNAAWIKGALRIIANVTAPVAAPATVAPSTVNQTATNPALANQVVTEVNPGTNLVPRNLIFDANGTCVAEINFGNHGGTATSGHAHVYPVAGMPITGHHVSGTPHFGNGDYPAIWRALPGHLAPARVLWT
jgi:hypothetical protein